MSADIVARMVTADLDEEFEEAYIYPIGDLHLGDPSANLDKLYKYLNWIGSVPNAYIILVGDLANIAIRSSISDVHSEEFPVSEQRKRLVRIFKPYAERILCGTGGNHEHRISNVSGDDFTEVFFTLLGIPSRYCPGEVYLKVRVGRYAQSGKAQLPVPYQFYVTHGSRGGRKSGSTANQLEDLAFITDADCYIAGHTHKRMAFNLGYHRPDPHSNTVVAVKRTFVSTGAYLKRIGYAVDKNYPPVWPGSPRIRLDGTRKDIHVSL